jgi:hypothetical protein
MFFAKPGSLAFLAPRSILMVCALCAAPLTASADCQGYFEDGSAVFTDSVPSSIDPSEVSAVIDENGEPTDCVSAFQRVIREGGLRSPWDGKYYEAILKLGVHPEVAEEIIALLSVDTQNPKNLKIQFSERTEADGGYAFIVKAKASTP